jgi:hypothetical protein
MKRMGLIYEPIIHQYHALWMTILLIIGWMSNVHAFLVIGPQGSSHTVKNMQLVLAHSGNYHALTTVLDYFGTARKFAVIIPIKGKIRKEAFQTVGLNTIDQLDRFTAPRWIDFYDPPPCSGYFDLEAYQEWGGTKPDTTDMNLVNQKHAIGLRPSARFTVGETDLFTFNPDEQKKFNGWLKKEGFVLTNQEQQLLKSYDEHHWAVVKVALESYVVQERIFIRPFQIVYESLTLTLPTGLVSQRSEQGSQVELYYLSDQGKFMPNNYRLMPAVTEKNFPRWTRERWNDLHQAIFQVSHHADGRRGIYLEHYWNWSGNTETKCDPCVSKMLTLQQLNDLGVKWLFTANNDTYKGSLFCTRLRFNVQRPYFDEDLSFSDQANSQYFQIRYQSSVPALGNTDCLEGKRYLTELKKRKQNENDNLFYHAGWSEETEENRIKLEVDKEGKILR